MQMPSFLRIVPYSRILPLGNMRLWPNLNSGGQKAPWELSRPLHDSIIIVPWGYLICEDLSVYYGKGGDFRATSAHRNSNWRPPMLLPNEIIQGDHTPLPGILLDSQSNGSKISWISNIFSECSCKLLLKEKAEGNRNIQKGVYVCWTVDPEHKRNIQPKE